MISAKKTFVLFSLFISAINTSYSYQWNECWGRKAKIKWDSGKSDTFRIANDTLSTDQAAYVDNIFKSWERVDESKLNLRYTFAADNDGKIKPGDGRNEIAIVTNSSFDEKYDEETGGVAIYRGDYNSKQKECHFSEVDIIISSRTAESDKLFQSIFSHELGHAVGMAHTTDYGNMLASGGAPLHSGSYPVMPLPDETQGLGDQYSNGSAHTDLGSSNFQVIKDPEASDVPDEQFVMIDYSSDNDFSVCPGDTIEPLVTTLNYGTAEKTAKKTFFLSMDLNSSSPSLFKVLDTVDTTIGAHKDYVRTISLAIPKVGISYATPYYLYAKIDSNSAIKEKDETNNLTGLGFVKVKAEEACPKKVIKKHIVDLGNLYKKLSLPKWNRIGGLSTKAIHIVSGTVKSKISSKIEDNIQTVYQIEVNESYRGAAVGERLTLVQIGGEIEAIDAEKNKVVSFQGSSHFVNLQEGQKYLLFLGGSKNAPILGGKSSVWIEKEKAGKTYLQTLEGETFFDLKSDGKLVFKGPSFEMGTSCRDCKDIDSKGKSRAVQVLVRSAGKALGKNEFIAKLKPMILGNPYKGEKQALSTGIDIEGLELVNK